MAQILPPFARKFQIRRTNPHGVTQSYVNDVIVARIGNEIYLTFLQIESPLVATGEEAAKVESVEAVTVARLIVVPQFAQVLIDGISQTLKTPTE